MFKNRNIKRQFDVPLSNIKNRNLHLEKNNTSKKISRTEVTDCFGDVLLHENYESYEGTPTETSADESDSFFNDTFSNYDIVTFDKSSSSSVSWSEEIDGESASMVQNEFERMERVLQGLESMPDYYDRDEYELWMKTFPMLM